MKIVDRIDVATLKREHALTDLLVNRGIGLRRTGERTFVARCPFHDDNRPSLFVDGRDQHFHCFGCGAHGDVLDFLMRADGIGFAAACEHLAGLPGIPLAKLSHPWSSKSLRRWDRLGLEEQVVLNTAAAIYQHCLWREPEALSYLRGRGIPDWVIRTGALGYADGHSLETYLRRHSGLKIAENLGLLRQDRGDDAARPLREFFAGRIVIPELRGSNCVWLIGRRLRENAPGPKYLALSGERPVLGFERAAGQRAVFLVEGAFDYLTAVGWKLPAWSPCGTHLPADRLGFLARAVVVYGVFDGDDAGRRAAATWSLTFGDRWRPIRLPDGSDLNDLALRPDGRAEFFRLLGEARHRFPAPTPSIPWQTGGSGARPD